MKLDITTEGQQYVYEEKRTPIFGAKEPIYISQGYERVKLNWKKPARRNFLWAWAWRMATGDDFIRNADGSIKLVAK